MVFDAMAGHKSKMLSMKAFKAAIYSNTSSGQDNKNLTNMNDDDSWASLLDELPTLKQASQILIAEAMKRAGGNMSQAAKLLGIHRQTMATATIAVM